MICSENDCSYTSVKEVFVCVRSWNSNSIDVLDDEARTSTDSTDVEKPWSFCANHVNSLGNFLDSWK